MWKLANPTFFMQLAGRVIPWTAAATLLAFAAGLWLAFPGSPADYQQGETVRIMYIHVPTASLAMGIFVVMASAALGTLVWRHPLADAAQKAAAPIGAVYAFICLFTGSMWGKPTWGTWWEWDARLTSMLVLFLIYLGLIALWRTIEDQTRAARAAAILTLVGLVDIPIIKFSVDWWNTLHQPASLMRAGGPGIDPSMLWPLGVMFLAFALLFLTLHLMAIRNEILARRVRRMSMEAAAGGESGRLVASTGAGMITQPHALLIAAAYLVSAAAVGGLALSILFEHRRLKQALARLERVAGPQGGART